MIDIGSDLQRAYDEGFKEGQETERPRAFGAGYKAGFDNASKRPKGEWIVYPLADNGRMELECPAQDIRNNSA